MSHILQLPARPSPPSPSPPYLIIGIQGTDVTSLLPPLIPLNLLIYFAPTARQWVLPSPDPVSLPLPLRNLALRTPYIGIDIPAPVEVEGLSCILSCMLQHSGVLKQEMVHIHPNLATSLAIHHAWRVLGLPDEGLRGLNMHIHTQLLMDSSAVSLWDMQMLWSAFPTGSEIVRAMGGNWVRAWVRGEYESEEATEMERWFRSSRELRDFFISLQNLEIRESASTATEEKEETTMTTKNHTTSKTAKTNNPPTNIMYRNQTRKVTPQERKAREALDFAALRTRLRRTRSDDSLRSVETAIWDPLGSESPYNTDVDNDDDDDGERGPCSSSSSSEEDLDVDVNVNLSTNANEPRNEHKHESITTALARTLETIRLRRESRLLKDRARLASKPSKSFVTSTSTHSVTATPTRPPAPQSEGLQKSTRRGRLRRIGSLSEGSGGELSVAELEERLRGLGRG